MKILMLPTYFGGISWWRFEIPARQLKAAGHEVYCPGPGELEKEVKNAGGLDNFINKIMPKYDIVHVGYSPGMELVKSLFEARDTHKVPIITDIDDNIDTVPTYNAGWKTFRPTGTASKIVKIQLQHSDGITFSTQPLAKALSYIKKVSSTVLENWIDIDSWDYPTSPERMEDKSIRLMVTGGNGRYGDWEIMKEAVEWAMNKYDGTEGKPMLRLFFLGATPDWVTPWIQDKLDPKKNRCFYIQGTETVQLFNQIFRYVSPDIVLSPTQKNEFNQSKSGLKFLEAALAGAVFVCTDFDTYSNAPSDCCIKIDNTFTQWQGAIGELIENTELRNKLANKAKSYVLDYCDAKDHITPRLKFYQSVLEDYKCRMSPPAEQGQEATLAPDKP